MKQRLYCIKDNLTNFKIPFHMENDRVAEREFKALVNDSRSNMYYAPNYYDLYYIGEFDNESGELIKGDIQLICNGSAVLESEKKKNV